MGNCQKSFGITIRLLRLSRKLKQEQLAENPVCPCGTSNLSNEDSAIRLYQPWKIASALSLRVKELFALEEIRRSPKGIRKALLVQLENCNDSDLLRFYACNKILCPSTSKILSNQNRFVAHLLLALSNSPTQEVQVEPFFLKRTYGEYKTGRQIALSARLLSYGAEGRLELP